MNVCVVCKNPETVVGPLIWCEKCGEFFCNVCVHNWPMRAFLAAKKFLGLPY